MTLVMVNNEELFHFSNVEDMSLWMRRNPDIGSIVLVAENAHNPEFIKFLEEEYPLEII